MKFVFVVLLTLSAALYAADDKANNTPKVTPDTVAKFYRAQAIYLTKLAELKSQEDLIKKYKTALDAECGVDHVVVEENETVACAVKPKPETPKK